MNFLVLILIGGVLGSCSTARKHTYTKRKGKGVSVYSKVDDKLAGQSKQDGVWINASIQKLKAKLKTSPRDSATLINLAQIQLFGGKTNDAEESIKKALLYKPGSQTALATLAQIKYAEGQVALSEIILNSLKDPFSQSSNVLLLKGLIALRRGYAPQAMALFEKSVAKDGSNVAARMNVGVIYLSFAQFSKAAVQFESVLREVPDHLDAKLHLAVVKSVIGATEDAERLYGEVASESSGTLSSTVAYNRGLNFYKTANYKMALTVLRSATIRGDLPEEEKLRATSMIGALKAKNDHEQRLVTATRKAASRKKSSTKAAH